MVLHTGDSRTSAEPADGNATRGLARRPEYSGDLHLGNRGGWLISGIGSRDPRRKQTYSLLVHYCTVYSDMDSRPGSCLGSGLVLLAGWSRRESIEWRTQCVQSLISFPR